MTRRMMAAFRLPHQAVADIDRLTAALQRSAPGKVSKADAIAWAVARALAEVSEKAEKPAPPPPVPTALPEGRRHRAAFVTERPTTIWGDGALPPGGNRS